MTHDTAARGAGPLMLRLLAWGTITLTFALLIENYLVHWQRMPGALAFVRGNSGGWAAAALYALAAALAVLLALRGRSGTLRTDSKRISDFNAFLVRGFCFAVLLIGFGDALVSFLRVENLLSSVVGDQLASQLNQTPFRATYLHMPLAASGFVMAFFSRSLGFIWLGLAVVAMQLVLVLGRFIFSYEQPFITDLVRMWYAALFLFASAYTLAMDAHVRVDVFYAGTSLRAKALINGIGSVVMGMPLCWTILILGSATSSSPLIGPFLRFEQGQQTYGMMTKYLLAVFLGIFAVTMMLQFASYVLKAGADWRGEHDPGASIENETAGEIKLATG